MGGGDIKGIGGLNDRADQRAVGFGDTAELIVECVPLGIVDDGREGEETLVFILA